MQDPYPNCRNDGDCNDGNDIENGSIQNGIQSPNIYSTKISNPPADDSSVTFPHRRKRTPPPRWFSVLYYLCLSTTALLLTLLARGTKLWDISNAPPNSLERGTANAGPLTRLLLAYAAILLTFFAVQGSDPGYITEEAMRSVCEEDGLDLIAHERLDGGEGGDDGGGGSDGAAPTAMDHADVDEEAMGTLLPQRVALPSHIEMTTLTNNSTNTTARKRATNTNRTSPSSLMLDDGAIESAHATTDTTGLIHNAYDASTDGSSPPTPLSPSTQPQNLVSATSTLARRTSIEPYRKRRRKICRQCKFAPPLRAHHCRVCEKCVATFDHHCQFIATCIGERNHCRFWWFLAAQTVGFFVCVGIVGTSPLGFWALVGRIRGGGGGANALLGGTSYQNVGAEELVMILITKIYLYPLAFISSIMWGLHTLLAVSNSTSFEMTKGAEHLEYLRGTRDCDLPFGKGLRKNIGMFCCLRDAWSAPCDGRWGSSLARWSPILWKVPDRIVRDSEDWWAHPWQNKYWSCC